MRFDDLLPASLRPANTKAEKRGDDRLVLDAPPPPQADLTASPDSDDPALATTPETAESPESDLVTEPPEPQLDVTVIRSDRRRKTAQARLIGSSVEIRIPAHCSRAEEEDLVRHFRAKFAGRRTVDNEALAARAERLADTYGLPRPDSIRWVSNQRNRWGSCTPAQRSIRLSNRLIDYPDWVIDYVVVHELAHLVEPNHSEAFWALVNAYPLTERARGYLMAKGQEPIDI